MELSLFSKILKKEFVPEGDLLDMITIENYNNNFPKVFRKYFDFLMEMNFKTTGVKGPKTKRFSRAKDYLQNSKTYSKRKPSEEEIVESFSGEF